MKKLSASFLFLAVVAGNSACLVRAQPGVYYAPRPAVYVAPRPVYVQPQPVYVQPRPVYVQPPSVQGTVIVR